MAKSRYARQYPLIRFQQTVNDIIGTTPVANVLTGSATDWGDVPTLASITADALRASDRARIDAVNPAFRWRYQRDSGNTTWALTEARVTDFDDRPITGSIAAGAVLDLGTIDYLWSATVGAWFHPVFASYGPNAPTAFISGTEGTAGALTANGWSGTITSGGGTISSGGSPPTTIFTANGGRSVVFFSTIDVEETYLAGYFRVDTVTGSTAAGKFIQMDNGVYTMRLALAKSGSDLTFGFLNGALSEVGCMLQTVSGTTEHYIELLVLSDRALLYVDHSAAPVGVVSGSDCGTTSGLVDCRIGDNDATAGESADWYVRDVLFGEF